MKSEHVATTTSKAGGPCDDCGAPIGVNNTIYKYATLGDTTAAGNGPGLWVCQWCHERAQRDPGVSQWSCERCGKYVNPVVQLHRRFYCLDCVEAIC